MPDPLLMTGMDKAFIGVATQGPCLRLPVYDRSKLVKILMEQDGMSEEDANEFIEFNVTGAWVGSGTPLVLQRMSLKKFLESINDG